MRGGGRRQTGAGARRTVINAESPWDGRGTPRDRKFPRRVTEELASAHRYLRVRVHYA